MKLPRDLDAVVFATMLSHRFGYRIVRQSGSHMQLVSSYKGREHHITVPAHRSLKVGTLSSIVASVAEYLELEKDELMRQLFG